MKQLLKFLKNLNIFSDDFIFDDLYPRQASEPINTDYLVSNYSNAHDWIEELAQEKRAAVTFFFQPYIGSDDRSFTKFETSSIGHISRRLDENGRSQTEANAEFYSKVHKIKNSKQTLST